MKYILGVESSLSYNLEAGKKEYTTKLLVSQDVLDWLNNHDTEISEKGERIYIMNKIRYVFIGIEFRTSLIDDSNIEKYQHYYNIIKERLEDLLEKEMDKQHEK